jgi:hypothetical protein
MSANRDIAHVPGARAINGVAAVRTSRLLLFLALFLIFLVFLRYYAKTPRRITVLQVTVGSFQPDLLMDKQPILIEDRVCDVRELVRVSLRYYYVRLRAREAVDLEPNMTPLRTFANATFVTPVPRKRKRRRSSADDEKFVIRARSRRAPPGSMPIDFQMRASQVLVLPPHWEVGVPSQEEGGAVVRAGVYEAYDIMHLFMYPLGWSGALDRGTSRDVAPDSSPDSPKQK